MPVLRHDHIGKAFCDPVDHGNNLLTVLHGKAAAGQEAVLNIDDQKRRAIVDLH
jgi:hypothetical protein